MCLDSSNGVEDGDGGSASLIDDETDATVKLGDHSATERNKSTESHRIAEMWRAGISGRFKKDEVNLTKIGAGFSFFLIRESLYVDVSTFLTSRGSGIYHWNGSGLA